VLIPEGENTRTSLSDIKDIAMRHYIVLLMLAKLHINNILFAQTLLVEDNKTWQSV
jgi:hypothetical protein